MGKYVRVRLKDLIPVSYIDWSQEQLDMKQGIIDNYNPRISPISISTNYKICDGNHRYTILLEYYGGDHIIIVKKQNYTKRMYNIVSVIIGLIILPFFLVNEKIKTNKKLHN